MSFYTFPEAVKGQSAASILRMVAECTSCCEARRLHTASLRRCAPLINSLPCRAKPFCEITENAYGDAEHILVGYSLRAWQALGMSEAGYNYLTSSLIDGRFRTPCPRLLSLLQCQNRTELVCPECALDDWHEHRHAVQYCAHCIDYVTRCYRHGALLESEGEGSTYEGLFCKEGTDSARRNSLLYARTAIDLSDKCPCIETWPAIVTMLTEKGYVRESGRWNLATLRCESERFFADGFEDARLSEIGRLGEFWVFAERDLPANLSLVEIDRVQGSPRRRDRRITVRIEKDLEPGTAVLEVIRIAARTLGDVAPRDEEIHKIVHGRVVEHRGERRHASRSLPNHLRELLAGPPFADADN